MKRLLFSLFFLSCMWANAQTGCPPTGPVDSSKYIQAGMWNLPMDVLKDAAKENYFKVLDIMHDTTAYDKSKFDAALDRYDYWRNLVAAKLKNKKAQTDFYNWVVSEARTAGKLRS